MFISYLFSDPHLFCTLLVLVVLSICCHEYMHAQVALWLGDTTAADYGHLTLNPFKQMGWISLLMLCFFGIAWGQVPVDDSRLRGKYGPILVSLAGPVTNLGLSLVFVLLSILVIISHETPDFASEMLLNAATLNMVLFMLNMFPIPGFDGWHILKSLKLKFTELSSEFTKGSYLILIMLLFAFFDYLYLAANFVITLEASVLLRLLR